VSALPPDLLDGVEDAVPIAEGNTNRNWRARYRGRDAVIRLCEPGTELLGIDRASEREAGRRAAAGGYGPEVLAELPERGVLVCEWLGGGVLPVEAVRGEALPELAAALRAFHGGSPLPAKFDVFRVAERHLALAREHGVEVPAGAETAMALAGRIEAALAGHPEHAHRPCHNDLLTTNLLYSSPPTPRLRIVDWEYAGMNDPFFDLGNLAVNNEFAEEHERRLLELYFGAPATPRRWAALRLMRIVSDLREGAWGLAQRVVSRLDRDYVAYADRYLQRLVDASSDPRVERWLEEARG